MQYPPAVTPSTPLPQKKAPAKTARRSKKEPLVELPSALLPSPHPATTRREHSLETAQDYVELIAALIEANGEARVIDIARHLGVTHVTVSRTIGRLKREGYVTSQPYRSIFLTDKGQALAAETRRRHEIVVAFLLSLGIPEPVALSDAEGIEHHVSKETLEAFLRHLQPRSSEA